MAKQSSNLDRLGRDTSNQVLTHFKNKPFRFHFVAWLAAAVPFALFMSPEFSVASLIGFGFSAIVFCTFLCVATYPLSGHFSFTIIGALVGAAMLPLGELLGVIGPVNRQDIQVSLLIGAIIGSTSVIWRFPLQIFEAVRKTQKQGTGASAG